MKKILSFVLLTAMVFTALFSFAACDNGSNVPVIGIAQYAEHGSLDNCRNGFIQGLKDAGLTEGTDFVIEYQNAGADDNINAQIAQSFASKNVALMCGIATPSATACFAAAEEYDIPVIFTAITDPIQAKLDKGNVTGTSDKLPVTAQLALIREIQPEAKTLGIVYTSSEPNSVSAIKEYEAAVGEYGFTLRAIAITSQAEVTQAVDTLISEKIDCITNLTDNTVVDVLSAILEKTNAAGIPVYGSEVEQVKLGCVASEGLDYYELGRKTGAMAAKILKGEAKASEMPYETIADYSTYVNSKAAAALNLQIPASVAEDAIESGN